MYICRIQYDWEQKAGSGITGAVPKYYNLFHFPTPVNITIQGETVQTKPNACILSAPRQKRCFFFPEDTTLNWFHAEAEIEDLLEQYEIPVNCLFYPENPGFIPDLFRKMRKEFCLGDPYREELLDGYTRELLIKLSRSIHCDFSKTFLSGAQQKRMQQLRWEVLSHPEKRWTVAEMAKSVALSPSRFHGVYKQMFGTSPMKDVIDGKIDLAKSLMLTEEYLTISAVAERVGYKNQQHFIRQFKAATGLTPATYRASGRL